MITNQTTIGELLEIAERLSPEYGEFEGFIIKSSGLGRAFYKWRNFEFDASRLPSGDPVISAILNAVCNITGISSVDVMGPRRLESFVWPRWLVFHLALTLTTRSSLAIGRAFGDRDHTSVLHGRERVNEIVSVDAAKREQLVQCQAAALAALKVAANAALRPEFR
jgi:hypothetical protein